MFYDSDMIIGKPIYNNDTVCCAITKMTIGFVTATAELEPKYAKTLEGMPLGSLGGGATVNPVGFLVIENQRVRFIPVKEESLIKDKSHKSSQKTGFCADFTSYYFT
jgi:uncharacterized spore protein YtfJ